jgi:hypothetical protein
MFTNQPLSAEIVGRMIRDERLAEAARDRRAAQAQSGVSSRKASLSLVKASLGAALIGIGAKLQGTQPRATGMTLTTPSTAGSR